MNIFGKLIRGDSAFWRDVPVVDAAGRRLTSDAYALEYTLAGPIGEPLTLSASADGDGWITRLTLAQSAALVAGTYWWQAALVSSDERITVGRGELVIEANLTTAGAAYDGRTLAEKALADAELALASFSASGGKVRAYTIGTRMMTFEDSSQILAQISYWKIKVRAEQGRSRNLLARFVR